MTNQNNASAQALASLATAPHEQETGLLNGQLAQGTSCVHEYAFDVKLQAALRVNASTPAHAIAVLEKVMDAAHCNGGMWPNGDPILFEASLAKSIDPVLFEIDGQELEVQGTLDDDSAMFSKSDEIKSTYLSSGCQASDVDFAIEKLMSECGPIFKDYRAAWEFLMEEVHEDNEQEDTEESGSMLVSLDGGKTFVTATNGVRIIYKGVPVPGENEPGELHINATSEGLISDLWVSREEHLDHNLGTSSALVDDLIALLVNDPVLEHGDSHSPGM